jgi:glutamate carboxypeptidase
MKVNELGQWVDAQKVTIEETLKEFVNLNTFTANEAGVDAGMEKLTRLAEGMGLDVEFVNDRHCLVKAVKGEGKPRIMLISHMDTVFPPDGDFLEYTPLDDGFVQGPGVGDIKGGMLMGLWAMKAVTELADTYDVQMIVSANEEIGSPTIRDWYMTEHIGADFAIGLEPGFPQGELTPTVDLGVVYQRRGYGAIRFKVEAKASHSGTPHLGLSAIEAMAQRIVKLHELNEWDKGISVNVGIMAGGISPNTVAGEATATVSFRYERMIDGETTKAKIEEILQAEYIRNEDIGVSDRVTEMVTEAFIPPMEQTEANMKMVDIVLAEAKRLGHPVVPIARGGGSDANFVSKSGTPSICGMGAPSQGIHTTSEKIYLPMMIKRIDLLASTLYRLTEEGIS